MSLYIYKWMSYKTYNISKGNHYCSNRLLMPPFHTNRSLSFNCKFGLGCYYNVEGPDNQDINKLFGITDYWSLIHKNSLRFGWRKKVGFNVIEIFAYWYVNSIRGYYKIGETTINNADQYILIINLDNYYFKFNNTEYSVPRTKKINKGLSFRCFPYFGGNQVAPQDMSIFIDQL